MNINSMDLPDCLEKLHDGSIRIAGHRVSLYDVLDAIYAQYDLDEIKNIYPTVPVPKLRQVIDFCRVHPETMQEYYQQQQQEAESLRLSYKYNGPTRQELLRRMEQKLDK